ncbi:hypothetical protein ACTXT7_001029 [Hymenolepis weldensis]
MLEKKIGERNDLEYNDMIDIVTKIADKNAGVLAGLAVNGPRFEPNAPWCKLTRAKNVPPYEEEELLGEKWNPWEVNDENETVSSRSISEMDRAIILEIQKIEGKFSSKCTTCRDLAAKKKHRSIYYFIEKAKELDIYLTHNSSIGGMEEERESASSYSSDTESIDPTMEENAECTSDESEYFYQPETKEGTKMERIISANEKTYSTRTTTVSLPIQKDIIRPPWRGSTARMHADVCQYCEWKKEMANLALLDPMANNLYRRIPN